MVSLATVEAQLKCVGCNFRLWGRSEIRELCEILLPGETIAQAVNGQYEAGFAMLVATDFRVLLVDKKPKYLTLKDIRFDMITELDFSGRMVNSTIRIYTPNKELRFTSTSNARMRKLFTHTQHRVMEIRHRFMTQQFQQHHGLEGGANMPAGLAMLQSYDQPQPEPLPQSQAQPLPEYSQSLYNPDPGHVGRGEAARKRLAAAMGAAGLSSLAQSGQVIKEYVAAPLGARWRKRPYGFSRGSS